jgi:branched-chain amino acid transport system permease protein
MSDEQPRDEPEAQDLPERPDAADRPRVGVDEWVDRVAGRQERGRQAELRARLDRIPSHYKLALMALPLLVLPFLVDSGYLMQVAIDTLLFMLLALGLNVAVGWAGLLDLGYIAFYGFGAYGFAFLASDHFGVHWQAQFVIPVVVAATVLLGFLVGLPSRRLVGDYLAIVTLFFLQLFLTILLNADRLNFPFTGQVNLTRGPNGISDLDPMRFFGWRLDSLDDYYYLAVAAFLVVFVGLSFVNHSRIGRAWRALREDPLAAEMMSMPVNRLKLLAFAFGAGVAGLTGTIFAASQGAVFPVNFDLTLLITLYAMVILGGFGSLTGVAVGAIAINLSLEALRTPEDASWIFFGVLLLVLPFVLRPWWRWAAVVGGTIVFGFVVRLLAEQFWERGVSGATPGLARVDRLVDGWVLMPADPDGLAKLGYLTLVASVLGLTLVRGWWRLAGFVPVLYLAACVWENVLVVQPAVARYILIGAMLVSLMASRPQGLFGTARVEIV